MKKLTTLMAIIAIFLFTNGCEKFNPGDFGGHHGNQQDKLSAKIATDWYNLQLRILLERNSSLNGVYFGYIGIALYESVRNADEKAKSLSGKLYQMPTMPSRERGKKYNWMVSANAAMAKIVKYYYTGLTPANLTSIDSLETTINDKLRMVCSNEVFTRSQLYGQSIATAVYNWSLSDNFNPSNAGYIPPVFAGAWQPTPPAFANGIQPYLATARPFIESNQSLKAPSFPIAYSETTGSDFYKMVKNVYDVSQALSTDQKNTAVFWVDQGNGIGYTPAGHDFSIVTQAIEKKGLGLLEAAEVYAKAGIAERDAVLVCFKSKYLYNLVRPVTYIRKLIDVNWLPFIVTPPHPEYPAAHAMVTGSVMEAAASVLGKQFSVTDKTYEFRGWPARTYSGLFEAAEEAGISRLYGGIHYQNSIDIGLSMAKQIGSTIGNLNLLDR